MPLKYSGEPMRIAFDYQIFCLQAYGGISRYYARLAEHLANSSQIAKVFSPLHCNAYLSELSTDLVQGCHISTSSLKWMRLTLPYNHVVSQRNMSAWQADVVHETYFSLFPPIRRTCPTVLTVYDMVHELFPSDFSKFGSLTKRKREAVRRADHIICISESTRHDLLDRFDVDPQKLSVVYLGFDGLAECGKIDPLGPDVSAKPFILFVGNRGGYKNFTRFIQAFASSKALRSGFDVIAFGGGSFTNTELELLRASGLDNQSVHQLGGSDRVLAALYSQASCFVYPSMYEGFGLPPLEAMAFDCPVVVSNTSSIPEVVGDAGIYFDPSSAESIAVAIEAALFSPSARAELIVKGRHRLEQFSWANCAAATLDVYSKIQR